MTFTVGLLSSVLTLGHQKYIGKYVVKYIDWMPFNYSSAIQQESKYMSFMQICMLMVYVEKSRFATCTEGNSCCLQQRNQFKMSWDLVFQKQKQSNYFFTSTSCHCSSPIFKNNPQNITSFSINRNSILLYILQAFFLI